MDDASHSDEPAGGRSEQPIDPAVAARFRELMETASYQGEETLEGAVMKSRAAMAISCDSKRLTEVRVCLGKDYSFHDCGEIARRTVVAANGNQPSDHAPRAA